MPLRTGRCRPARYSLLLVSRKERKERKGSEVPSQKTRRGRSTQRAHRPTALAPAPARSRSLPPAAAFAKTPSAPPFNLNLNPQLQPAGLPALPRPWPAPLGRVSGSCPVVAKLARASSPRLQRCCTAQPFSPGSAELRLGSASTTFWRTPLRPARRQGRLRHSRISLCTAPPLCPLCFGSSSQRRQIARRGQGGNPSNTPAESTHPSIATACSNRSSRCLRHIVGKAAPPHRCAKRNCLGVPQLGRSSLAQEKNA